MAFNLIFFSDEAHEVGEENYSQLQKLRGHQRQEYLNVSQLFFMDYSSVQVFDV